MKLMRQLKIYFLVIVSALGSALLAGLLGLGISFNVMKYFYEHGDMTPLLHGGYIGIGAAIAGLIIGGIFSAFVWTREYPCP